MIYVYQELSDLSRLELQKWESLLDEHRLKKLMRYKFQKDKTLCLVAGLLLQYAVLEEYGLSAVPRIIAERGKKPYFRQKPLCFNLSHCDTAIACALDKEEVGIDIQNYEKEILLGISKRFLTEKEEEYLSSLHCPLREATRFWTLKEAYGKYSGIGLRYALTEKDFSFLRDRSAWQNYEDLKVLSICMPSYALSACAKQCLKLRILDQNTLVTFAEAQYERRKRSLSCIL